MKEIITAYDVVTENYQAKRHVAMHLDGVGSEDDVKREIAQISERGTHTVLVTDEQYRRFGYSEDEYALAIEEKEGVALAAAQEDEE